jgi:predicted alpha/beta-fold hydrolase
MTNEFNLYDYGIPLHIKLDTPDIDFDEERKMPLMILLHGLTGHMEERHIVALKDTCLSHGFSVLRADLYGHGKSGGAFRDHTLFKWLSNIMCITDFAKRYIRIEQREIEPCTYETIGTLIVIDQDKIKDNEQEEETDNA